MPSVNVVNSVGEEPSSPICHRPRDQELWKRARSGHAGPRVADLVRDQPRNRSPASQVVHQLARANAAHARIGQFFDVRSELCALPSLAAWAPRLALFARPGATRYGVYDHSSGRPAGRAGVLERRSSSSTRPRTTRCRSPRTTCSRRVASARPLDIRATCPRIPRSAPPSSRAVSARAGRVSRDAKLSSAREQTRGRSDRTSAPRRAWRSARRAACRGRGPARSPDRRSPASRRSARGSARA